MLTDLREQWQNNAWVIQSKATYTYDAKGKILTELSERLTNNIWGVSGRDTYTYDANGNMLADLYEKWQNNAWVNAWRSTYTYDANGNLLVQLDENWLVDAWENSRQSTYTYDANGNSITGKYNKWEINEWQPYGTKECMSLYSNKIRVNSINDYRFYAHWVSIPAGINNLTNNNYEINVFPNPANEIIAVSYKQSANSNVNISIYDVVGKLVYTENTTSKNSNINTSNLNDGIYFLKLTGKDFNTTEKLVISHK